MRSISFFSICGGILVMSLLASFRPGPLPADPSQAPVAGKFMGNKACGRCHGKAANGDAHGAWLKSKHAGAFATLASPAALKLGKEKGIAEPQKSKDCLPCHVTAYGEPAKLTKKIKPTDGVQCESCHGPGQAHQAARMAAAGKKGAAALVPPGEVQVSRSIDSCGKCHNEKSPTFKSFCLKERMAEIEHFDPRKKRSAEEIEKLRNTCSPDCKVCKAKEAEKEKGKG